MSRGTGRSSGLEAVQHGTVEVRRRPWASDVRADIGRVPAVIGAAQTPGPVVLPPASGDVQRARVGRGLPDCRDPGA